MTLQRHRSRVIGAAALTGALASGLTAATLTTAPTTQAQPCPESMTESIWIAGCLPNVDPEPEAVDQRGPNQLPTLYGIPCSGNECLGLSRVQGGPPATAPTPDTDVRSSP